MTLSRAQEKLISLALTLIILGVASLWRGVSDFQKPSEPVSTNTPQINGINTQASPSSNLSQQLGGQD